MIKRIAFAFGLAALSLTPTLAHAQENGDTDQEVVDDDTYPPEEERALDVKGFLSECVKDAPWVKYSIKTLGFTANPAIATITLSDVNGKVIEVRENQPLQGEFLYPGAAVDKDGNATDWPGWDFDETTQEWIELGPNEGDTIWRKGIKITVEVNPTGITQVSYPDASPICAGPKTEGSSPPVSEDEDAAAAATLPRTGSDGTSTLLQVGALLVVAGGIVVVATHRRRTSTAA